MVICHKGETTPPSGDPENKPSTVTTSKVCAGRNTNLDGYIYMCMLLPKNGLFYCQEFVRVGQTSAVTEEEDDEESHLSEGQVVAGGSQSVSDDSEISEELEEPDDGGSFFFSGLLFYVHLCVTALKPPFVII